MAGNFHKINAKQVSFPIDLFQFFQNFLTFRTIILVLSNRKQKLLGELMKSHLSSPTTHRKRRPTMTIRPTIFPTFCHLLLRSHQPIPCCHHRSTIPERTVHFACHLRISMDCRSGSRPMPGTFWWNNVSPIGDPESLPCECRTHRIRRQSIRGLPGSGRRYCILFYLKLEIGAYLVTKQLVIGWNLFYFYSNFWLEMSGYYGLFFFWNPPNYMTAPNFDVGKLNYSQACKNQSRKTSKNFYCNSGLDNLTQAEPNP